MSDPVTGDPVTVTGEHDARILAILSEMACILASLDRLGPEQTEATRILLADIARLQAGSQTSLPFGKGSVNI